MVEPRININGEALTPAQAMAVRVACTSTLDEFASNPDALGADERGRLMVAAYADRLREVLRIMLNE